MTNENPTTAVPADLRLGERVELVALGDTVDLVRVGDRGTVKHLAPMLVVVFDAGPIMGILPDLGDAVRRVGS